MKWEDSVTFLPAEYINQREHRNQIKAQAQKSFDTGKQEGRREVVEWIQRNHQYIGLQHPDAFLAWIQLEPKKWERQLKEWGI